MSVINRPAAPVGIETDEVTVVVATRNRPDRLRQTVPHHHAPTIIVDNASDQPLPGATLARDAFDGPLPGVAVARDAFDGPVPGVAVARDAFDRPVPGVAVVRLAENIGAAARNVGVRQASTPYVAFADDDSYWEPGSLARAVEIFRNHPRAALLTAKVLVGPEGRLDPVSACMAAAPIGTPPGAAGPSVLGFLSCAVVVRRDAFLAAGGFQPKLFVYGEEALLAMDLAAAGHQLSYVPELVVRHFPEPAGRDNRARSRREARNRALTALLRRPPTVIARTLAEVARTQPAALTDLARDLPWALRHRRPLPAPLEAALGILSRG
ncbi:GT2 family glycosyltransferase [Actinoplanes octamycinicus]|uniref:GT2 family glycosyltransferase n=1 Tax=Actinoplanes octamycinicus TaxID=135948 RepID=A0A7W7GZX7_9ACTN|nr:glycosyltransferase [Actinoplanes octamycinicus]MBB4741329.1 GT2 family glycosyltransferase [Actinoplanes octamycinicus]